jgi:type IV secretory pathway TrbD component
MDFMKVLEELVAVALGVPIGQFMATRMKNWQVALVGVVVMFVADYIKEWKDIITGLGVGIFAVGLSAYTTQYILKFA